MIEIQVRHYGVPAVQEAMKQLRRRLQRDNFFKTYRQREFYLSPSELKRKKMKEAIRSKKKLSRQRQY